PIENLRSRVANHLNDISKFHPERVADWLERHLPGAPAQRRALLRHASRSLIKRGDRRVLDAWGLGRPFSGDLTWKLAPRRIALGESVALELTLRSRSRRAQTLVVDYAIHHVKANGTTSPKVFKGWTITLAAGETRTLTKRHAVKPITTRTYHAGRHGVDVRINGKVCAESFFALSI
ncbi:DNA alkylation repair protein, partial [Myxococcota bacterium]|nr:DNA alkylation repair protein [Myxococcota bacterium]